MPEKAKKSRMEQLGDNAQLPDIDAGLYLIECAIECGSTDWQVIRAWAESVGVDFQPWEYRAMRELCAEYLTSRNESRNPRAVPPYRTGQVVDKQAVADQVRRAIRGG